MSATDFRGPSISPLVEPAPPRRTKRPPRRVSKKPAVETVAAAQKLAGFAIPELHPGSATLAPLHLVLWLQPELKSALREASGLHIERRFKVPVPDFRYYALKPDCPSATLAASCEPRPVRLVTSIPQSDLTPLGSETRAQAENPTPKENFR